MYIVRRDYTGIKVVSVDRPSLNLEMLLLYFQTIKIALSSKTLVSVAHFKHMWVINIYRVPATKN